MADLATVILALVVVLIPVVLGLLWYLGIIPRGKKEKKRSIPRNHQKVTWKSETNKYGLSGSTAKKVILNSFNKRELPFSKHFVKAFKDNFNSPIWDQTDGKNVPDEMPKFKVNPGKLEWEE